MTNGLVAIPGSLMFRYVQGWPANDPDASRMRRLIGGLNRVCSEGSVSRLAASRKPVFRTATVRRRSGALFGQGEGPCVGNYMYQKLDETEATVRTWEEN